MQPYSTRVNYASYPALTTVFGDPAHLMQHPPVANQSSLHDHVFHNYPQTSSSSVMPVSSTSSSMLCPDNQNTHYGDLKKEQPLMFAQRYLAEFTSLPVKPEFDKYLNNSLDQWNTLKLGPDHKSASSDDLIVLNTVNENINTDLARQKPKPVGRKRMSQYQVKVEELPLGRRVTKFNPNLKKEFSNVQIQYDIKPEAKTYHSFTIMPKNRMSVKRKSTDELIDLTDSPYNSPPQYPSYSESFNNSSASTASSSNMSYQPTAAATTSTSGYLTPVHMAPRGVQNRSEILQEIREDIRSFVPSRPRNFSPPSSMDQNKNTTVEYRSPSFPKHAATAAGQAKKREISRTFCNGARAIVSYFSLDDERVRIPKTRKAKTSPFSEFNSRAPVGTVP